MLSIAQNLSNKGFYRRLNTIPAASDAPANDVLYHNACWVTAKRESEKKNVLFKEQDYINALSDIEIVHYVEKEILEPREKVLDMNTLNEIYRQILSSNGKKDSLIQNDYKKHLKDIISKNISGVSFVKSKNPSKPEQVISKSFLSECVDNVPECSADNLDKIWKVAKIIRSELLNTKTWSFTGSFDDFVLPPLLTTLIKWILLGEFDYFFQICYKGIERKNF